ncbi:MAG: hypothetical protein ACP5HU_10320 [Phycisphaerae bacterium]
MNRIGYRYRFSRDIDHGEARDTLVLALLAAEGLFGHTRVRMDAAWAEDETLQVLVVDAATLVGMTVCLIFTAFLTAEFGAEGFDVRQVSLQTSFTTQAQC